MARSLSGTMKMLALLVTLLACASHGANLPEEDMTVPEMINYIGYVAEEHPVQTEDGYILTMHRIPYGKSGPGNGSARRPVVFLQHGLEGASSNWVANLANESAGFVMADAGFDVWMGNFRGNTWSKRHAYLDPKSKKYWNFSWDEMAMKDLPAMLSSVLALTGADHLHYVGHSQGTMTPFALFSVNHTLGAKVKTLHALGPVATVGHIKNGLLHALAPLVNEIAWVIKFVGVNEFLPSDEATKLLARLVCGEHYTNKLCADIIFLIGGPDSNQLNDTRTPIYVAHCPAGTSTKNFQHFGQMVNSDRFCKFDYGLIENELHYGQARPPVYDITQNTVPTYLYWGDKDILADPEDVKYIIERLPNLRGNTEYHDFNHLDFIWGMRARTEIYDKIVSIIKTEEGM